MNYQVCILCISRCILSSIKFDLTTQKYQFGRNFSTESSHIPYCVVLLTVSRCEEGWEELDGSCYFFSNGRSLGLRYEYAERFCNLKNSHLALIGSQEEADWIAEHTYVLSGIPYSHNNKINWAQNTIFHWNFQKYSLKTID